jgi:TolB protein
MKWLLLLIPMVFTPALALAEPRPTLIAMDPAGGSDAVISADGRFILTSSRRSGVTAIWMYTIADRTWSQITDGKGDDTEPSWSPDSSRAVFVSKRDGQTDLWIVDIATRALKRLTNDAVEEEYPAWSPDGRLIVFTGGPWKIRNFFVVDPDGGPPRAVLLQAGNVGACSFAGGSARLVCHSYDSELGNLIEIDVPSGRFRRLTKVDQWYYKPSESPDGRWIAVTDIGDDGERIRFLPHAAFAAEVTPAPVLAGRWPMFLAGNDRLFYQRQIDNGIELRLYDRMSGTSETIAVGDWTPGRGSLSPDHRMIAYCATDRAGSSRIFVYDRDDGTRRLVEVGADACFPAWSPDGLHLALTIKQNDRWEVGIVDKRGSNLKILTSPDGRYHFLNGPLSWKPDGRQIAFAAVTRPYESNVFLVDIESRQVDHLSQGVSYDEGPSFSLDGQSILFMSTRGGSWTWGLFSLRLSDGTISTMLDPELIERRFPMLRGADLFWVESNVCLNTTMLAIRHRSDPPETRSEFSDLKWFDLSADGRYLLMTTGSRRTEYWMLDLSTAF